VSATKEEINEMLGMECCTVCSRDLDAEIITEGRMRGKQTTGRRRIQMLHDLANDGGCVALKRELRIEKDGDT